jgi:hypothetical protein
MNNVTALQETVPAISQSEQVGWGNSVTLLQELFMLYCKVNRWDGKQCNVTARTVYAIPQSEQVGWGNSVMLLQELFMPYHKVNR